MDEVARLAPVETLRNELTPRDELRARIDQLDELAGRPSGPEVARLANQCGLNLVPSTLSDIRRGQRVPREDTLDAFVKACLRKAGGLGVTVPPLLADMGAWQRLREAARQTPGATLAINQKSGAVTVRTWRDRMP
jgi:hypothetical protein